MDFSCDRCGRRFFVPDDLVHGRVFRAKCEDCNYTFDVTAPAPGAAAASSPSPPRVKIAITDADVAALVEAASPAAPTPAKPAPAPVPPTALDLAFPELPELTEPGMPLRASDPFAPPPRGPAEADLPLPALPEPVLSEAERAPSRRALSEAVFPEPALPAPEPLLPVPVLPEPIAPPAAAQVSPIGRARIAQVPAPRAAASPAKEARSAPREPAPSPKEAPAPREPAPPPQPPESQELGGVTGEYMLAAGTRHRHRAGIAIVAGVAVAVIAAGVLLSRMARPGPQAAQRGSSGAPSGTSPSPGTAPLDPSALLARPGQAAGPAGGKPAPAKRRRIIAGRDDKKLLDLLARKEDVAMAAPADDVELDSAKDVLDPAAVERTVATSRRAFDACVTKVMRLNPNLRIGKRATLIVTVQPNGRTTGAWIAEEQIEGTDLGRCLVEASSRMAFPTFEGEAIDVAIPLSLSGIQ